MSAGLKEQWGVDEAAQAGPDEQSQDLKKAFEKLIDSISENLQYTAANGERSRREPLEARRGELIPRYQDVLAEIDPADRHPEQRHDEIADERAHDLAERRADDDADGHVDDIALHRKFPELGHQAHWICPPLVRERRTIRSRSANEKLCRRCPFADDTRNASSA